MSIIFMRNYLSYQKTASVTNQSMDYDVALLVFGYKVLDG